MPGRLIPLGTGLWFADGSIVSFKGFDYPTRMAVVRLANGGLWIWSPTKLSNDLADEVRALGPIEHLVSPSSLHYLFLSEWHAAFPDAKVWATASTFAKCPDIAFRQPLADRAPSEWDGQIDQFYFHNSRFVEELIFFHRESKTALIAELSQTFSDSFLARHWPAWLRWIARASKMTEGIGHPPIDYRITFRSRASARPKIRELIGLCPEHVVVAHGEIVRSDAQAFVRRAFSWLL